MESRPAYVAVVGPAQASAQELAAAESVGRELARAGAVLVCGGLGGAMAAACRGAAECAGVSVGILPGFDRAQANEWVTIAIVTGLGELRNGLIIRAVDAVVALGGGYGTLSELALALKTGVPVVGLSTWSIDGVETVDSPERAVARALELARRRAVGGQS